MGGVADPAEVIHFVKSVFVPKKLRTRNILLGLSTEFTPVILLLLAALIFLQRLLNEHINCVSPPEEDIRSAAINQYCFVTGTYTITNVSNKVGRSLPYPGVGPVVSPTSAAGGSAEAQYKFHLYFQWVPYLLLVQAALLALPNIVWKQFQKPQLAIFNQKILARSYKDFDKPADEHCKDEEANKSTNEELSPVAIRFVRNLNHHKEFSIGYFACEVLNLAIIVLVFLLSDQLLDGDFTSFGADWFEYIRTRNETPNSNASKFSPLNPNNPFDRVFPKMSKCEFKKFGPGGSIQNHDILCVLTLNVIHEKVFLLLWFWFWLLIAAQVLLIIYRLILLAWGAQRCSLLLRRVEYSVIDTSKEGWRPNNNSRRADSEPDDAFLKSKMHNFFKSLNYCDWFMLKCIADNTDRFKFTRLLQYVMILKEKVDVKSLECRGNRVPHIYNWNNGRASAVENIYSGENLEMVNVDESSQPLAGHSGNQFSRNNLKQRGLYEVDAVDGQSTLEINARYASCHSMNNGNVNGESSQVYKS